MVDKTSYRSRVMTYAAKKRKKASYRAAHQKGEATKAKKVAHLKALADDAYKKSPAGLIEQIYNTFKANQMVWGHYFFEHHFRMKTPTFHVGLLKAANEHQYLAVAAPRESAKSTILAFLYAFHGIVFKRFRFIVIVSNTFKKSAMTLDAMKTELRDNEKLQSSFKQPLVVTKDAEGDSEFRHPDGFTTKVLCKGADQIGSIRGVKFGAYRPDLFLIDDVEDDELVRNPQRRQELQNLYDEALVPAGERGKCQFIIIGTILHDDSQLAKMVQHENSYSHYHKIFLEGHLDPNGPNEASLWPEKWTLDWLHWMQTHQPTVYAKEIQNNPVAGLLGVFQRENFRYWKLQGDDQGDQQYVLYGPRGEVVTLGYLLNCKAAIACDLAWSEKRQADYCVIMPGLLTPQSDLLVWPYFAEKGVRPDRLEEILFTLDLKLKALTRGAVPIGFEKAMLEKVVAWMLRQAMKKRNHPLLMKELQWDTDQTSRIELRLSDRYSQHMIYHQTGMGDLEHQLLRFPSGAHQDIPDALQGLVQLLQHPKKLPEQKPALDHFEQMRQLTIEAKKPRGRGLFQRSHSHQLRRRLPLIPARKAWLTPTYQPKQAPKPVK